MEANEEQDDKQEIKKRSAFSIINNVRDHCHQSDAEKVLMYTLATYCDADGRCFPGNNLLAEKLRKSSRTVRRLLQRPIAQGEVEVLSPGAGRDKQRVLCLKPYLDELISQIDSQQIRKGKEDTALSPLNRTRPTGKAVPNNQREQPPKRKKGFLRKHRVADARKARPRNRSLFSKVPYPKDEEEMYQTLDALGIESNPDYDGDFLNQMQRSDWTVRGQRVRNWPELYRRRLEVTQP